VSLPGILLPTPLRDPGLDLEGCTLCLVAAKHFFLECEESPHNGRCDSYTQNVREAVLELRVSSAPCGKRRLRWHVSTPRFGAIADRSWFARGEGERINRLYRHSRSRPVWSDTRAYGCPVSEVPRGFCAHSLDLAVIVCGSRAIPRNRDASLARTELERGWAEVARS
jgi:hypothetical protein